MWDARKIREYYEREALALKNHQEKMYFGDLWDAYWHGTRLQQIVNIAEKIQFTSFIDVGCAEGFYIKLLSPNILRSKEFCVVGLDIAKSYLAKAKTKAPNALLVLGDAHKLPFKEGSFDLVLCSEVFEHVLNPASVLKELVRVSRKYLILTAAGENLFHFFIKKLGLMKTEDPYAYFGHGHIHEMSIHETLIPWAEQLGCKCLNSLVTCYFPLSFMRKHRAPTFTMPIIKVLDRILSEIPVIKNFATVQIALLSKQ
jgi:SAM-dependent methyltransferase